MIRRLDKKLRKLIDVLATAQCYLYRAQSVPVWVSADGRVTPITEMETQWLRNSIGVVERGVARGGHATRALPAMRAELARREAERRAAPVPSCDNVIGSPGMRTDFYRALAYEVGDDAAEWIGNAINRIVPPDTRLHISRIGRSRR